jgi:hypothetical protein
LLMADIWMLIAIVAFFGVAIAYARASERL